MIIEKDVFSWQNENNLQGHSLTALNKKELRLLYLLSDNLEYFIIQDFSGHVDYRNSTVLTKSHLPDQTGNVTKSHLPDQTGNVSLSKYCT